jgi:hypothetical protein
MPTFYLCHSSDGRSVISDIPLDWFVGYENFRVSDSVEAETWLHAKDKFWFDLTPLQTQMLPLGPEQRAVVQRMDANYGRSPDPWKRSVE